VQKLLSSSYLSKNVKIKIYRTIILPIVLYGSETWYPTLREESTLRVFENGVLRRIFGPKRNDVTGEWSVLPNNIRVIKSRRLMDKASSKNGGESRCIQGFSVET
jgi:hypothetical protein